MINQGENSQRKLSTLYKSIIQYGEGKVTDTHKSIKIKYNIICTKNSIIQSNYEEEEKKMSQ